MLRGRPKRPRKKWYALQILRTNHFGNIELKSLFVSEERYNKLVSSAPVGSPVQITRDLDDQVTSMTIVNDVPALELY